MKHISILTNSGSNLASIDNPRRAFLAVNDLFNQKGNAPLFKVQLIGITREVVLRNGLCTLHTDATIKNIEKTDLIIIPAIDGDIATAINDCKDFIPWILQQYKKGAELASLCVGAFMLAATGLLNGKSCSTHWRAENEFKKLYPKVQLITDKIITDENGIYTSGGAFSSANLILYIIEKYAGREVAIHCSKIFQVDLNRESQSPFIIFEGQKDHNDDMISQAQVFIEENYQEKILIEDLCTKFFLSRRSLERRFKKATNNTLVEYMQRVKVEVAKKSFELESKNINEVMYDVGYNDTKAFRSIFKRYTGLTPVEYRTRYNKMTLG